MTMANCAKFTLATLAAAVITLSSATPLAAQYGGSEEPPQTPREAAPVDLTGQWVSVISEDWRWRMVTPPHGDYASVPLTAQGKATADSWDLAADNAAGLQCKAFGAGGVMRIPGRLRISWQDEDTLKVETDAGQQVRLYNFISAVPSNQLPSLDHPLRQPTEASWQGETRAQWFRQRQSRGLGFGGPQHDDGAMRAYTQNLRAGYLRPNGVPYSENATITEQYTVIQYGDDTWLVVTAIVEDPENLAQPFVTSTNYRKENSREGWSPYPCRTDPPLAPPVNGE